MNKRIVLLGLILATSFLSGCSQAKSTTPTAMEKTESPTLIICRDFLGLVDEADTGVITDIELRERYKLIYEAAKLFDDKELLSGATKTLAAVTRGNKTEYFAEIQVFGDVCYDRLGYEIYNQLLGN